MVLIAINMEQEVPHLRYLASGNDTAFFYRSNRLVNLGRLVNRLLILSLTKPFTIQYKGIFNYWLHIDEYLFEKITYF